MRLNVTNLSGNNCEIMVGSEDTAGDLQIKMQVAAGRPLRALIHESGFLLQPLCKRIREFNIADGAQITMVFRPGHTLYSTQRAFALVRLNGNNVTREFLSIGRVLLGAEQLGQDAYHPHKCAIPATPLLLGLEQPRTKRKMKSLVSLSTSEASAMNVLSTWPTYMSTALETSSVACSVECSVACSVACSVGSAFPVALQAL